MVETGQSISLFQGEGRSWIVTVENESTGPVNIAGWILRLIVQNSETDPTVLLQLTELAGLTILPQVDDTLGQFRVDLMAIDTYGPNAPVPGSYCYTLNGRPANVQDATPIVPPSLFAIRPTVGLPPLPVLADAKLSLANIFLVNGAGEPIIGRRVLYVPTLPQIIGTDDPLVSYGILPSVDRLVVTTNLSGYAGQKLLRGQNYKLYVEGAPFTREFTVPNVATFDVLQVASLQPDPFSIVISPPFAIRVQ